MGGRADKVEGVWEERREGGGRNGAVSEKLDLAALGSHFFHLSLARARLGAAGCLRGGEARVFYLQSAPTPPSLMSPSHLLTPLLCTRPRPVTKKKQRAPHLRLVGGARF